MNLALGAVGGELLVVSQFTLMADTGSGRRPSFAAAAPPGAGPRASTSIFSRSSEAQMLKSNKASSAR